MYYLFAISVLLNLTIAFFLLRDTRILATRITDSLQDLDEKLDSKIDYVAGEVENLPQRTDFDQITMEFDEFKEEVGTRLSESLENV